MGKFPDPKGTTEGCASTGLSEHLDYLIYLSIMELVTPHTHTYTPTQQRGWYNELPRAHNAVIHILLICSHLFS